MKTTKKYKQYKNLYSRMRLHLVFCTRFRRKIFTLEGVEKVFLEALVEECTRMNVRLLDVEYRNEWVHIYIECPPDITPSNVMTSLKRTTSAALKKKVLGQNEHATVWSRNGLIADDITFKASDITEFLLDQKKRSKKTEREELSEKCKR